MDPVLSSGDMASVAGGYVFPVRRHALITISVTSMPPAGCLPALRIVGRNALPRHPSDAGPTASRISDIVDRIPLRSSLPVLLDRDRVVPLRPELVEHGGELLDAGFEGADALPELRAWTYACAHLATPERAGGGIRGGHRETSIHSSQGLQGRCISPSDQTTGTVRTFPPRAFTYMVFRPLQHSLRVIARPPSPL